MDFFARQDQARKNTRILVIYFTIAVILTILAVYGATVSGLYLFHGNNPVRFSAGAYDPNSPSAFIHVLTDGLPWFDKDLFLLVTFSVGLIVFLGSSVMTFRLSQGGKSVASLLGGRPLNPSTTKTDEIKLRNVVEEMAIASGLPMPEIYLLDHEEGINAFAAGYTISDAVIGVTRGSLKMLTRDELQGVVAHEFSHILNGDMKLNMRLSCLAHGILFIAETGKLVFQIPFRVSTRSSGSRKGGLPPHLMIGLLIIGAALTAIGSIGYFFTSALKAAISRQREFLADAAAVQFTRNPAGISGVLKKIGGFSKGSRIDAPQASQASHFFFSRGLSSFFGELLSTHPPLGERIRAIDPHFQYEYPKIPAGYRAADYSGSLEDSAELSQAAGFLFPQGTAALERPAEVLKTVGHLKPAQVQMAARMRESLPEALFQAAHEPFGARGLVLAVLMLHSGSTAHHPGHHLQEVIGPELLKVINRLLPLLSGLPSSRLLALIDLSLPALRLLSPDQFREFRHMVQVLIEEDSGISLFEYTLQKILFRHLEPAFHKTIRQTRTEFHSLKQILPEVTALLGALAYFDSEIPAEIQACFDEGTKQLNIVGETFHLPPPDQCTLLHVDQSLQKLEKTSPGLKRNILYACATVVMHNGHLSSEEAELLRAIADTLDCPIPPFATNKD